MAAGAGAAAAQTAAAILRICCCSFCIARDLRILSLQRDKQQQRPAAPAAKENTVRRCSRSSSTSLNRSSSTNAASGATTGTAAAATAAAVASGYEEGPVPLGLGTALRALLPPGVLALLYRYASCFAVAAATRNLLRASAFEAAEGSATAATSATAGATAAAATAARYDMQHVRLWMYTLPLWAAELLLGLGVFIVAAATAGRLLLQMARRGLLAVSAAATERGTI